MQLLRQSSDRNELINILIQYIKFDEEVQILIGTLMDIKPQQIKKQPIILCLPYGRFRPIVEPI